MAKKSLSPGGWLFKEEPTCYSFNDLERDGSTLWAGVKNALARQHLRNVKRGDRVLYYHTGKERAIVGEMRVLTGPTADANVDDPKAIVVKVGPVRPWRPPVTLEQIKRDSLFAEWELLRISRLSVMPVPAVLWQRLEQLCQENGARDGIS